MSPRFQVIEKRGYYEGVLIEAVDEDAALRMDGDVIGEASTDSWGDALVSVEQVADDADEIELP